MNTELEEKISGIKHIWHHPDFDDLSKREEILGDMPDEQQYNQEFIAKVRELNNKAVDFIYPCHHYPLLSLSQSRFLFKKYNCVKHLAKQDFELKNPNRAKLWLSQKEQIKHILIGSNLRMCLYFTKKYRDLSFYEDIVSQTYLDLCNIVDVYDWRRGVNFITYASNAIMRNCSKNMPKWLRKHGESINGTLELEEELQTTDSHSNIEESERSLLVERCLSHADDREKEIIHLYYFKAMTLEAIGETLQISKERVRQIKAKGIAKIRKEMGNSLDGEAVAL